MILSEWEYTIKGRRVGPDGSDVISDGLDGPSGLAAFSTCGPCGFQLLSLLSPLPRLRDEGSLVRVRHAKVSLVQFTLLATENHEMTWL